MSNDFRKFIITVQTTYHRIISLSFISKQFTKRQKKISLFRTVTIWTVTFVCVAGTFQSCFNILIDKSIMFLLRLTRSNLNSKFKKQKTNCLFMSSYFFLLIITIICLKLRVNRARQISQKSHESCSFCEAFKRRYNCEAPFYIFAFKKWITAAL